MVLPLQFKTSIFLLGFCALNLSACDKTYNKEVLTKAGESTIVFETYRKNGVSIPIPNVWSLLTDDEGVVSDRYIAFETQGASRITFHFYKNSSLTFASITDKLVGQLNLDSSEKVSGFTRSGVAIEGYNGVKLNWVSFGLLEVHNSLVVLQLTDDPIKSFVTIHLFDEEIQSQQENIEFLLSKLLIDTKGLEL